MHLVILMKKSKNIKHFYCQYKMYVYAICANLIFTSTRTIFQLCISLPNSK